MTSVVRDGVQTDARLYDGASRVIQTGPAGSLPQAYINALNGTNLSGQTLAGTGSETHINRYNANGQIVRQDVYKSDNTPKYAVVYDALPAPLKPEMGTAGGYDGAGNLLGYTVFDWTGGNVTNYANTYGRAEGYRQLTALGTSTVTNPGGTVWEYGNGGELTAVNDVTKPLDNRSFVSDMEGTILYAEQAGQGQHQLVVNGQVLGRYGQIRDENNPTLPNGAPFFLPKAEFNFGYQPIDGNYPSASPGTYAVSAGDTLQGIARGAYGDESLWYLIADANGLGSNADLKAGQVLTIPTRVGAANNANSFKPYDPSRTIGDTNPNMPMPEADKGGGCGAIGQIIMVVVAVVATIFTAGVASVGFGAGFGTIMSAGAGIMTAGVAGGAIGAAAAAAAGGTVGLIATAAAAGAVGSIVSQGVGIAIGAQDEFSWKGVALGAIGAGVSAGVGAALGPVTSTGFERVLAFAGRGALASAATQGIAVATGLQASFNWRGVAASAVGAGVGAAVSGAVGPAFGDSPLGEFATRAVSGFAAGVATAAMRGGRANVTQVATDAFGNALGDSIAAANSSGGSTYVSQEEKLRDQFWVQSLGPVASRTTSSSTAWNSGSLPELYESNFGPGVQQTAFLGMPGLGIGTAPTQALSLGSAGLTPGGTSGGILDSLFGDPGEMGWARAVMRSPYAAALTLSGDTDPLTRASNIGPAYAATTGALSYLQSANTAELRALGLETQGDYESAQQSAYDTIDRINYSASRIASVDRGHASILNASALGSGFISTPDDGPKVLIYPADTSFNGPSTTVFPAGSSRPSDNVIITPVIDEGQFQRGTEYPGLPEAGWKEFILTTPADSGLPPLHVMYSESTDGDPTLVINHRYGNKTVEFGDGTRYNLPPGMTVDDIPRTDPVGDALQRDARIARSQVTPLGDFSGAQQGAIERQRNAGNYIVADQLDRKYTGSAVQQRLNGMLGDDPALQGVQSNPKGVDYTKPGSDLSWELLSDTKYNLDLHQKRMADTFFRYIKFPPK